MPDLMPCLELLLCEFRDKHYLAKNKDGSAIQWGRHHDISLIRLVTA